MKEVYNDRDQIRVGQAKSLLESAGISCFVRNETSGALIGASIAGVLRQFDPELCVAFDQDYPQAHEIIKQWLDGQKVHAGGENDAADWICPGCGETVPGSFGECWACQSGQPVAG